MKKTTVRGLDGVRTDDHPLGQRGVDEETTIFGCPEVHLIPVQGQDREALMERWHWEGFYAQSLIFHSTDVTETTDPELRALAISYFGLTYDEEAIQDNNGGVGDGEGSATVTRQERFTFVNVLKGTSRSQWW